MIPAWDLFTAVASAFFLAGEGLVPEQADQVAKTELGAEGGQGLALWDPTDGPLRAGQGGGGGGGGLAVPLAPSGGCPHYSPTPIAPWAQS